jgi:hypothetical protein
MDVDTAVTVPCNKVPLVDESTGQDLEDNTVTYNSTGMEVYWNFCTPAGVCSSTTFTPTTGSNHDWTHMDGAMYKIEIPASGGTVNNDTEGTGWITGKADACLAFSGPTIEFRHANLNNTLVEGSTIDVNITAVGADAIQDNNDGRLEVNLEEIADVAVSTSTAQLGVNVVSASNDAIEDADIATVAVNTTQIEGGDATDALDTAADTVTVTSIGNSVITALSIADGAITSDGIATGAIGAAEIAVNAIGASEIGIGAIDADAIADGAITDAKVANDVQVDVLTIETAGATDTINAQADAAIETYGLDHLVSASVAGADVADDSIIAQMVGDDATADWDTFDNTTESLEALRNRGDAAWITAVGFSTHAAADVWSVGTRILTANTNFNDPTAASIADAVWDEDIVAAHNTADTAGALLDSPADWATAVGFSTHAAADVWSVGSRTLTAATNITDDGGVINVTAGVVDEVATLTGHTAQTGDNYTRLGAPAGASVSADIAAVKSDTAAILVDTADIETDLNDGVALTSATETQIDNIETRLNLIPF